MISFNVFLSPSAKCPLFMTIVSLKQSVDSKVMSVTASQTKTTTVGPQGIPVTLSCKMSRKNRLKKYEPV